MLQAVLRSAFLEVMDERGDDEIFIEVTLIEGVNDTLEDAEKLVDFLRPFGQRCKVNLIPYNSTGVPGFRASPMRNLLAFQALVRPPQSAQLVSLDALSDKHGVVWWWPGEGAGGLAHLPPYAEGARGEGGVWAASD